MPEKGTESGYVSGVGGSLSNAEGEDTAFDDPVAEDEEKEEEEEDDED